MQAERKNKFQRAKIMEKLTFLLLSADAKYKRRLRRLKLCFTKECCLQPFRNSTKLSLLAFFRGAAYLHTAKQGKGSNFLGRYTAVFGKYIVTDREQRDKNSSPTISLRPIINGGTEWIMNCSLPSIIMTLLVCGIGSSTSRN